MMIRTDVKLLRALAASCLVALGSSASLNADDTEIYQSAYNDSGNLSRPKVLVVLDNSGSMRTLVPTQKPAYDPDPLVEYDDVHDDDRLYWSTTGNPPPKDTDSFYIKADTNRCAESYGPLATVGYFQTKARRWETSGDDSWNSLSTRDTDPKHMDCQVDVVNANPDNGPNEDLVGYPKKPATASAANDEEYSASTPAASDVDWGNDAYTFYTARYMDWYYDDTLATESRTRIDIAQEVVGNLVNANTGIDFGLAVFNYNYPKNSYNGGRIVRRIINNMSSTERSNLVDMVDGLVAQTSTPLCETSYEVYRYIAGQTVDFGDNKKWSDTPAPDASAVGSGGKYIRPSTDCTYTYVILMTDGFPQYDEAANSKIKTLTGKDCEKYDNYAGSEKENCLPQLTEYMATTDLDGDSSNGDQFGITYTIAFETPGAMPLLEDAAANGKGQYFVAEDADTLTAAFRDAILGILSTDASFTSPSVAVNTFTRTQSRDEVFFSMFKPSDTTDWPGNIKKLKIAINSSTGVAALVDRTGAEAIDGTGAIAADADTYWSTNDGGDVEKGGMGALLAAMDPAARTILTNSGPSGALEELSSAKLDAEAFGFDPLDPDSLLALLDEFGATSVAEMEAAINWGRGYLYKAVEDDNRNWILGDMLHSQPLVINYGARSGFTKANPDLRIVVGTNAGFLHMFGNTDGVEDWAFFPKELAAVLKKRGQNSVSADHVYGIDATAVLYAKDLKLDGTLDHTKGDKAYVYVGLRRGGRKLYALDISNPDDPKFLWHISEETPGFEELGQTWSEPVVAKIPGYTDSSDNYKPVLIFGAGYDTNKDEDGIVTEDDMGRGLFIVDAETGALVWSVTPAGDSDFNMQETGLEHSVPGVVKPFDSNGDELVDRIYFADTGGNIWRVDMPDDALPTDDQDTWRIVKLAELNGTHEDEDAIETDRRFFNTPDIVRTSYAGKAFDAVLIGSGDRANPKATDVENEFYMIRDEQVGPYFKEEPDKGDDECDPDEVETIDFRCNLPFKPQDLYNASANLLQEGTTESKTIEAGKLAAAHGWRIALPATGEKSLSRSITIAGKVYFGTFAPDIGSVNLCEPTPGTGRLYVISLLTAGKELDFDQDGDKERSWIIGSLIPDTPSPHFGEDGEIRLLLPPGAGDGVLSSPFLTGASVPEPYGSYWYREAY